MILLVVTGTRDCDPGAAGWAIHRWASAIGDTQVPLRERFVLVVGCARGVDRGARDWAARHGIPLLIGRAHWQDPETGERNPKAGSARNGGMAQIAGWAVQGGAEVHAFALPGPDSVGTWDMVCRLKAEGIEAEVNRVFMGEGR